MKGSMSQKSVSDPTAFERANYIKILEIVSSAGADCAHDRLSVPFWQHQSALFSALLVENCQSQREIDHLR